MATTETPPQINVAVYLRDLRAIFETQPVGRGSLALLEMVSLQLSQAAGWLAQLSPDAIVQRSAQPLIDDVAAAQARLGYMLSKASAIASSADVYATKLLQIYTFVANPILNGVYAPEMMRDLPQSARRGITLQPGGQGKSQGEAFIAATSWNQSVVAANVDASMGRGWAADLLRESISKIAVQLQLSAPGEDPTAADATVAAVRQLAAAPGALLQAITGVSPRALLIAGVVIVVLVVAIRSR